MTAQRFRMYNVDQKGTFGTPLDITFDNAIEAFDYAYRQRATTGVELRRGTELIARLRVEGTTSNKTAPSWIK